MKNNKITAACLLLAFALASVGCDKDDDMTPTDTFDTSGTYMQND